MRELGECRFEVTCSSGRHAFEESEALQELREAVLLIPYCTACRCHFYLLFVGTYRGVEISSRMQEGIT
jgi:hypothetical protein